MKRTIILALIILLAVTGAALSAQVSKEMASQWSYQTADEADISGFRIYNQDRQVVIDNVAPNARTVKFTYTYDETVPQAFSMVAVGKDGRESSPSNTYVVSPPFRELKGVGTFTIKIGE